MNYVSIITPTICVILAGVLAFRRTEGWGWFLFVAFILGVGGFQS